MVYIVIAAVWFLCGFASAGIANMKNRDPMTYFAVGFFFGVIGLIVAIAVPSIRLENLTCKYLNTNSNSVDNGTLQPAANSLHFTASSGYAFDIPYSSITSAQKLTKKDLPRDFPKRAKMFAENMLVLEIKHSLQGQESSAYFSIYKTVISDLVEQVIDRARQREVQMQQTQQAYKKCPYCAEMIMADAVLCRHCGSNLAQTSSPSYVVTHDIVINGQIAFKKDEIVTVESVSPDPNQPQYKYVINSKSMNQKFRLSDNDVAPGQ